MVVSDDDEARYTLVEQLQNNGYECIIYLEPLKAMDNLEEVEPDIVLFNVRDYPRHWKPFLHYLRQWRDTTETLFILMSDRALNYEESKKATDLQVNGIIDWNAPQRQTLGQLQQIVVQKRLIHAQRSEERLKPFADDQLAFLFTHPRKLYLVTGEVVNISSKGVCMRPHDTSSAQDLNLGDRLSVCSLRMERRLCSLQCDLVYLKDEYLGVSIQRMRTADRERLAHYIDTLAKRRSEQD